MTLKELTNRAKGKVDLSHYSFSVVGKRAFENCAYIDAVILPTSVREIEDSAFSDCSRLKSINTHDLPKLKSIGKKAFCNCVNLDSLIIPDSCSSIGDNFLYNCHSIQKVAFPDSCNRVDLSQIGKDRGLTVKLPSSFSIFNDLSKNTDINFEIDDSKPTNLKKECEGLITFWTDTDHKSLIGFLPSNQWNNFSDSIISKLKKTDEDTIYFENGCLISAKKEKESKKNILECLISKIKEEKESEKNVLFSTHEAKHHSLKKLGKYAFGLSSANGEIHIYHNKNDKSIDLSGMHGNSIQFAEICDSLEELHLPHVDTTNVSFERLPDFIRDRVILYVPWNCKNKYLRNPKFNAFKEIREDPPYKRILSVVEFYIDNTTSFLTSKIWISILLTMLFIIVVLFGCLGIVSIMKKRKIPHKELKQKVFYTSLKMLILAIIGYLVLYWFCWIVLFDSLNNTYTIIVSNVFGVIGAFGAPWIWIFSGEIDLDIYMKTVKSLPAIIRNWPRRILLYFAVFITLSNHFITKHWKSIISLAILITSVILLLQFVIVKPNNDIKKSIEQWGNPRTEEQNYSALMDLISIYPNMNSIFISNSYTNKYDSIIASVYDSLVYENKIALNADTLLNGLGYNYDNSKLVYPSIYNSSNKRYNIIKGSYETMCMSLPDIFEHYEIYSSYPYDFARGCIYYVKGHNQDAIAIHKITGITDNMHDTLLFVLPNNYNTCIGNLKIKVAENENVVLYSDDYNDYYIQCWDCAGKKILYEKHFTSYFDIDRCCISNDVLYYFDNYEESLIRVSLKDGTSSEHKIPAESVIRIRINDDGNLLLVHGWGGEVGMYNPKNKTYTRLFMKHYRDIIEYNGIYYLLDEDNLLKYKPEDMETKVIKIKNYLEKVLHK